MLGFCARLALRPRHVIVTVGVVVVLALLGAALEAYQSTLDGREASAYDALANLAGATAGALAAVWLTRLPPQ